MNYYIMPGLKYREKLIFGKINENILAEKIIVEMGYTVEELRKKNRRRDLVLGRQILSYILYTKTQMTLKDITKYLSPAVINHTTIVYAVAKVKEQLESKFDNEYKYHLKKLKYL